MSELDTISVADGKVSPGEDVWWREGRRLATGQVAIIDDEGIQIVGMEGSLAPRDCFSTPIGAHKALRHYLKHTHIARLQHAQSQLESELLDWFKCSGEDEQELVETIVQSQAGWDHFVEMENPPVHTFQIIRKLAFANLARFYIARLQAKRT